MESPSRVLLGFQSKEFGWFPSMSTSSTPIRVDTRDVRCIHAVFSEGEGRVGFDDLVVQFDVAANAIANEVSADSVVTKVFLSNPGLPTGTEYSRIGSST